MVVFVPLPVVDTTGGGIGRTMRGMGGMGGREGRKEWIDGSSRERAVMWKETAESSWCRARCGIGTE